MDAEVGVKRHLAPVQTFETGLILQPACMVIDEERYEPPMQPLHFRSYHDERLLLNGTTYVVPKHAMQGTVHLPSRAPQPDIMW